MNDQTWNPDRYRTNTGYVSALGTPLLDLLGARAGERVLDLGCGEGELASRLSQRSVSVVGVDASAEMVAATRARGIEAHVMDGQELAFHRQFDAVFSNAALHWMTDPEAVLRGVNNALVPGGRFVGEFGGKGNIARIIHAMQGALSSLPGDRVFQNPWYFPDTAEYRALLTRNGFTVSTIELIPRPTPLEHGIRGWLDVFARHVIDDLPHDEVEPFLSSCEAHAREHLWNEGSGWFADYVRLRFVAQRE